MDNGMEKDKTEKIEEILLAMAALAGVVFMIMYWR